MKLNLIDNVKNFWDAYGSFGELKGNITTTKNEYCFCDGTISLSARTEKGDLACIQGRILLRMHHKVPLH